MHAPAREAVQVHRERGDKGLALAGLHLGDLSLVEHDAADELNIEMAHADRPLRRLAHHGEGLGKDLVEGRRLGTAELFRIGDVLRALADGPLELVRPGPKLPVREAGYLRLESVDRIHADLDALEHAFVLSTEYFLEDHSDHLFISGGLKLSRILIIFRLKFKGNVEGA